MNSDQAANLLADIFRETTLLSHSLPSHVNVATEPPLAKVAWKFLSYREALLWRSEELAKSARNELLENRLVSSALLTRALFECAAGFHYLTNKIVVALQERDKAKLDETAMRLLLGTKWEDWEYKSINVLTLIQKLDDSFPGARKLYDALSELAHPNWNGTARSYSRHDRSEMVTHFGAYVGDQGYLFETCLRSLSIALPIISKSYNECTEKFASFNDFCNEAFEQKSD